MTQHKNKIFFIDRARNTQIAGQGSEILSSNFADKQKYGSFNTLFVQNSSQSDIEIRLDGETDNRVFLVVGGGTLNIEYEDGLFFDWFKIVELENKIIPANKIYTQWTKTIGD